MRTKALPIEQTKRMRQNLDIFKPLKNNPVIVTFNTTRKKGAASKHFSQIIRQLNGKF